MLVMMVEEGVEVVFVHFFSVLLEGMGDEERGSEETADETAEETATEELAICTTEDTTAEAETESGLALKTTGADVLVETALEILTFAVDVAETVVEVTGAALPAAAERAATTLL